MIKSERPDGVLLTFGGQTALNCGVQLNKQNVFREYNVQILGTPISSIEWTEDRHVFAEKLFEINEKVAPCEAVYNVEQVTTTSEGSMCHQSHCPGTVTRLASRIFSEYCYIYAYLFKVFNAF